MKTSGCAGTMTMLAAAMCAESISSMRCTTATQHRFPIRHERTIRHTSAEKTRLRWNLRHCRQCKECRAATQEVSTFESHDYLPRTLSKHRRALLDPPNLSFGIQVANNLSDLNVYLTPAEFYRFATKARGSLRANPRNETTPWRKAQRDVVRSCHLGDLPIPCVRLIIGVKEFRGVPSAFT